MVLGILKYLNIEEQKTRILGIITWIPPSDKIIVFRQEDNSVMIPSVNRGDKPKRKY